MEGMLIKGVAKDTDVAVITILNVPDEPGMSFRIFGLLAQKNINVDIILQSTGRDGKKDISFTCAEGEAELAMRVLKESAHFNDVSVDTTCACLLYTSRTCTPVCWTGTATSIWKTTPPAIRH